MGSTGICSSGIGLGVTGGTSVMGRFSTAIAPAPPTTSARSRWRLPEGGQGRKQRERQDSTARHTTLLNIQDTRHNSMSETLPTSLGCENQLQLSAVASLSCICALFAPVAACLSWPTSMKMMNMYVAFEIMLTSHCFLYAHVSVHAQSPD
jgi:hypothetical protein